MRIRSHALGIYAGMTAARVGALALPGTLVFLKRADGTATTFFYVFVTPFFLVGLALLVFGLRGVAKGLLGGVWGLEISDAGVLGQPLAAILTPPRQTQLDGELRLQLRALARTSRGGGGVELKTLWETQWTEPAATLQPKTGIPLILPLPSQGPSTSESANGAQYTRWQLHVVVPSGGSEQELVFDVPVYGGGDATRLPL